MKTMKDLLEQASAKTHARYLSILNNYYPAHRGTGFTERNLTNNFVVSLQAVLGEKTISWFEAPLDIKTKTHIDAVVFDLERQCSFMIESKRFSYPDQKIAEVNRDIERLKNPKHCKKLECGLRGTKILKRYGIVLADVWRETARKIEISKTWPNVLEDKNGLFWFNQLAFDKLNSSGEWKMNYRILIAAYELTV
jgi:hypothetical protein